VTGPLISNHFHLVVETPQPNLVAGMKWLLGTCTSRFNRRHGEFGHVFSGRYKSLIVDGSGNGYIKSVCDYVHLNPVRARQRRRADHYGPELREADLAHAERLVKNQLRQRGWREADLGVRRKGDPEKVQMASELRAQTTMTLKWIAQRLKKGASTHVSNCLVQKRKKGKNVNSYD
jgi:hypothetical protein